jgi:hypothetical protein
MVGVPVGRRPAEVAISAETDDRLTDMERPPVPRGRTGGLRWGVWLRRRARARR